MKVKTKLDRTTCGQKVEGVGHYFIDENKAPDLSGAFSCIAYLRTQNN